MSTSTRDDPPSTSGSPALVRTESAKFNAILANSPPEEDFCLRSTIEGFQPPVETLQVPILLHIFCTELSQHLWQPHGPTSPHDRKKATTSPRCIPPVVHVTSSFSCRRATFQDNGRHRNTMSINVPSRHSCRGSHFREVHGSKPSSHASTIWERVGWPRIASQVPR